MQGWLIIFGLMGCAPDLSEQLEEETGARGPGQTVKDGIVTVTLDATSEEAWRGYDLIGAGEVPTTEPWHLAFQRYKIDLNEDLGMQAARIEGATLEEVTDLPLEGWATDAPDADQDGISEYALADWYDYNEDTHILTPADRVYVVRSSAGDAFKLAFGGYYDAAGTPAILTFRWAPLPATGDEP